MIRIRRKIKRLFWKLRKKIRRLSLLKKVLLIIFIISLISFLVISIKIKKKEEPEDVKIKDVIDMQEDLDRIRLERKYVPPTEDVINDQIMQLERLRMEAKVKQ